MSLKSLQQIALIALVLLVTGVWISWMRERARLAALSPEGVQATYKLDCQDTRSVVIPRPGEYVLRLALLRLSEDGLQEAVLDAVEVHLSPGDELKFEMGFATLPDKTQQGSLVPRRMYGGKEWERRIRRRRRLPPEFDSMQLHLEFDGIYYGQEKGTHLLTWQDIDGHAYRYGVAHAGGGTAHLPQHSAVMQEDVPIARMYLQQQLALFAVVTRRGSPVVAHPGQRDDWRKAFQHLRTLPHLVDREAVEAAVQALDTSEERRVHVESDFQSYGPLLDYLTAAWVLGDAVAVQEVERRLDQEPGLLEEIRSGVLNETKDHMGRWFQDQTARPWLAFVSAWMEGSVAEMPEMDGTLRTMGLRLLELTESGKLAGDVVRVLRDKVNYRRFMSAVLSREVLGQTESTRAEYQKLRLSVIGSLGAPWSLALRSRTWLLLYCLLVPLLALWVFFWPSLNPAGGFRITRGFLFFLALFSAVTFNEFPFKVILIPVWWCLAFHWLRGPFAHGFFERALIWLALTLVSIDSLQVVGWYVKSPPLDIAASWGLLLCWILVGMRLQREQRWYAPGFFLTFLVCWIVVQALTTLGTPRDVQGTAQVFRILGAISLLVFIIRGDDSSSRGNRVPNPSDPAPDSLRARATVTR